MDDNDRSQNEGDPPAALGRGQRAAAPDVINPNTGENMSEILRDAYGTKDIEWTDQGFDFSAVDDVKIAVFQTIGAASVCWEDPGGAGVFDSTRAAALGAGLVAWLEDHYGRA